MSTTYIASTVLKYLDEVQAEIDKHLALGGCSVCKGVAPCAARQAMENEFHKYGMLPKRKPGITQASPSSSGSWFNG